MRKRDTVIILALASMISARAVAGAQTNERLGAIELFPVVPPAVRPLFASDAFDASIAQQPAGPPPTPLHTGIKAMAKHLVTNFQVPPIEGEPVLGGRRRRTRARRAPLR